MSKIKFVKVVLVKVKIEKVIVKKVVFIEVDIGGGGGVGDVCCGMVLIVCVEINLLVGGLKEIYDNIFKSIRVNLIDEWFVCGFWEDCMDCWWFWNGVGWWIKVLDLVLFVWWV